MTVRLTMERKCCIVVPENTIIRQIKVQGNWIKINSDAALNSSTTTLAAVARDHRGDIVKVWSKHVKVCLPIQAEASAILWAVELAIKEQWNLVCFEGDAKAYFDPLSSLDLPPDWTINSIINDIHNLARSFSCCNFVWVSRSCNAAAHATAKFGLLSSPLLYFNKGNLPEVIESVCKNDYRVCSVSLVSISLQNIKKKKKKKKTLSYLTVMEYKTDKNEQDIYNVYEL